MSISERFLGVFTSPKKTLEAVAEKPVWVDAFVIILIVVAVYTYIITPIVQTETVSLIQNNTRLQERMGKDRFDRYVKSQENPAPTRRLVNSVALAPAGQAVGFLLSAVFLLIFGRIVATSGSYKQVLAVLVNASFIDKVLGNAVRLLIILAKKSVFQTSTSVVMFFPKMTFGSPAFIVLSQLDFFGLWTYGVLAFGLAAAFKVEVKKALFVSYGFFLLKSIVYIALGFLSRSFMGG